MKKTLIILIASVFMLAGGAGSALAGDVILSPGGTSVDAGASAGAAADVDVNARNAEASSAAQQSAALSGGNNNVTINGTPMKILPETVQPTNPWLMNAPANGQIEANFQSTRMITLYKKEFTPDQLRAMMDGGNVKVIANPFTKNAKKLAKKVTILFTGVVEEDGVKKPRVYPGYDCGGYVTVKCKGKHTISVQAVANAAYEAWLAGCDGIQVTVEGYTKHARGFSFGMSLGGVIGWLAGAGNTAESLSINGPGISWGDSYNLGKPHVSAVMLKKG